MFNIFGRSSKSWKIIAITLNLQGYLDWINQAEDIEPVNDDEQEDEQQFNGINF